ncbi:nitrile hydratase subunit beta [Chromatiales bacterium (ex Bugula neritina AB1)]|nr:nitrile hydratase subunit beta [Chromatiales bacterium (ex Bugula neritina AB1)]
MNGIHDMGGMHGFGNLKIEEDEPVFHRKWEGRVFAMTIFSALSVPGGLRYMVEKIEPQTYLTYSYYEKWMHANIQALLQLGIVSRQELDDRLNFFRHSADTSPPVVHDRKRAEKAISEIYKPLKLQIDETTTGPFYTGQTIRAKSLHPQGHTRLPGYCKGKLGTIEKTYGTWTVDDTPPAGCAHAIENLYRVRFEGRELWGDDAEANQALYIDMFESYLEAADPISSPDRQEA